MRTRQYVEIQRELVMANFPVIIGMHFTMELGKQKLILLKTYALICYRLYHGPCLTPM